jgi:hypothetical protein
LQYLEHLQQIIDTGAATSLHQRIGQPAGFPARPGRLLWQVGENAYVVIDDRSMRAARAGGAMITLGVTDLDDILARLDAHGIGHGFWRCPVPGQASRKMMRPGWPLRPPASLHRCWTGLVPAMSS